jgi:hypothetical protein
MRFISRSAFAALVAVLAMSAVAAASASGMEFAWHVNGSKLTEGQSKEVRLSARKSVTLEIKLSGLEVEVVCTKTSVEASSDITGGTPGTARLLPTLEGCQVKKPKHCTAGIGERVKLDPLTATIVEGVGPSAGKDEVLLTGRESAVWTVLELHNAEGAECPLNGETFRLEGSDLAEITPQKEEKENMGLVLDPSGKYKNAKGEEKQSRLQVGGETESLTGELGMELTTKEKFAAY